MKMIFAALIASASDPERQGDRLFVAN